MSTPKEAKSFKEIVWEIVSSIPKGKVMTYGQIAALAGYPGSAQVVGWILHYTPPELNIPCQRVVNRFGGLASGYGWGGVYSHKKDLEKDGVEVREDFTVDLQKYQWFPPQELVDEWLSFKLERLSQDS